MQSRSPSEFIQSYERSFRRGDYKKAYQSLERLHHEFPKDEEISETLVQLCLHQWNRPEKSRKWLLRLIRIRDYVPDYLALCEVDAKSGDIAKARNRLKEAEDICEQLPRSKEKLDFKKSLKKIEKFIDAKKSLFLLSAMKKKESSNEKETPAKSKKSPSPLPKKVKSKPLSTKALLVTPKVKTVPTYHVPVQFVPLKERNLKAFYTGPLLSLKDAQLWLDFSHLIIQGDFNELLCLNALPAIDKYWYQIETVKKVLKLFHGRVLLCDEVGLGKTIEAGMILKEYLMRQMAKTVLILTPPSLVSQWKEEMLTKFGLDFLTTDDTEFTNDEEKFWKTKLIIASIHTAKSSKHLAMVTKQSYDIVVVDEAHHLRNRRTVAWKAVNAIHRKFIFLLTATPVQNNLIELFNLITLLKPGQFKTEQVFKKEFVTKGNLRKPLNKDKLRDLLKEVMIRNTRSAIDLKLPKRFATTLRLEPTKAEAKIYQQLNLYIRDNSLKKGIAHLLLRETGSSLFALEQSLAKMAPSKEVDKLLELIRRADGIAKGRALVDLVTKNPKEKKIIFTQYLKSMDYIIELLTGESIPFVTFHGKMSTTEKDAAIQQFRDNVPILVSTESGGEGRNIQFCNTIINFDLPWNPMRIEQRIGRLHRIGQTKDVFIFNLSVNGTIEDHIIDILDNKINMFEMVIGEIEPIIGQIDKDQDFAQIILEIWMKNADEEKRNEELDQFGDQLVTAKNEYFQAKDLDEEIFGEDYEI